jgi:hypothetical protein
MSLKILRMMRHRAAFPFGKGGGLARGPRGISIFDAPQIHPAPFLKGESDSALRMVQRHKRQ